MCCLLFYRRPHPTPHPTPLIPQSLDPLLTKKPTANTPQRGLGEGSPVTAVFTATLRRMLDFELRGADAAAQAFLVPNSLEIALKFREAPHRSALALLCMFSAHYVFANLSDHAIMIVVQVRGWVCGWIICVTELKS